MLRGVDVLGKLSREFWNERVIVFWSGGIGWKLNIIEMVIRGYVGDVVKGLCFLVMGRMN